MSSREVQPGHPGYIGLLGRWRLHWAELWPWGWWKMNASKITCHVGDFGSLNDAVGNTPKCFPIMGRYGHHLSIPMFFKVCCIFVAVAWAISLKPHSLGRRTDPREPEKKSPDSAPIPTISAMQFLTITTVVALAAARPFHNEARTLAVDLVGRSPKAWLQGSPAAKCNDRKVVDSNSHLVLGLCMMENVRFSEMTLFFFKRWWVMVGTPWH